MGADGGRGDGGFGIDRRIKCTLVIDRSTDCAREKILQDGTMDKAVLCAGSTEKTGATEETRLAVGVEKGGLK